MEDVGSYEFVKSFVGLLSLMNPLGAIPILLGFCDGKPDRLCKRIPYRTAVAIFVILIVSIWFGDAILKLFGISIEAFQAGGGVLILLMAIHMLEARQTPMKQTDEETKELGEKEIESMMSVAVVPLAIPLMAGPGTISFSIVQGNELADVPGGRLILSILVLALAVSAWFALYMAEPIGKKLGDTGLNIVKRLMGMVLAAIGVQMIAHGLVKLMPGLAG
jgi:multiple antibiotic resistance protein